MTVISFNVLRRLYDVDMQGKEFFFVMEYMEEDLSHFLLDFKKKDEYEKWVPKVVSLHATNVIPTVENALFNAIM